MYKNSFIFMLMLLTADLAISSYNGGMTEEEAFNAAIAASLAPVQDEMQVSDDAALAQLLQSVEDTFDDASLARALQQQEEALGPNKAAVPAIDTSNDEAMARAFQEEEERAAAGQGFHFAAAVNSWMDVKGVKQKLSVEENQMLEEALPLCMADLARNAAGLDVHVFNGHIKKFGGLVMKINGLLGLNTGLAVNDCISTLRALRAQHLSHIQYNCEAEIAKLLGHLGAPVNQGIEAETGVSCVHMLSILTSYLTKTETPEKDVWMFFNSMAENFKTAGGCFPGYTGRFLALNIMFILRHFNNIDIQTENYLG